MNELTIVDTDVLIDAAHQISAAVDCLAQIEHQSVLAVSVITQMELLVGCRDKTELRNTEHCRESRQGRLPNKQLQPIRASRSASLCACASV